MCSDTHTHKPLIRTPYPPTPGSKVCSYLSYEAWSSKTILSLQEGAIQLKWAQELPMRTHKHIAASSLGLLHPFLWQRPMYEKSATKHASVKTVSELLRL